MAPLVVTQFAFDADTVLAWLDGLRTRGIAVPVLVGVPGPASITRLLRYAAMCGFRFVPSFQFESVFAARLGQDLVLPGPAAP